MLQIINLLLPEVLLIALGYIICRTTKLNREIWDQTDRLLYYFFVPVLLFRSISKGDLNFLEAGEFVLAGCLLAFSSVLLAFLLRLIPFNKPFNSNSFASGVQVGFRVNTFLGLAIAWATGDSQILLYMSLLIGIGVPVFNFAAVWSMSRGSQLPLFRELAKNPLILGTFAGLLASMTNVQLPTLVGNLFDRVGIIAITLGILAVGAGMQFRAMGKNRRISILMLICKHFCIPFVAVLLVMVFQLPTQQSLVLLVFAALPTAPSCYVLAKSMGYESSYIASLVTCSTLLGIVSLGVVMSFKDYLL